MARLSDRTRSDPRHGNPPGGAGRFGFFLALLGAGLLGAAATQLYEGWSAQREAQEQFAQRAHPAATPVPELPAGPSLTSLLESSESSEPSAALDPDAEEVVSPPTAPSPESPGPAAPAPAAGALIGRLRIPAAGLDVAVFEGVSSSVLRKGPGHVPGTSLPTRGNNCVIAGHRDSFFRPLSRAKAGDSVFLSGDNDEREYRLTSRRIVSPDEVAVMAPTQGEQITLVTCYPFHWIGPAPYRLVWQALPAASLEALAKGPPESVKNRR